MDRFISKVRRTVFYKFSWPGPEKACHIAIQYETIFPRYDEAEIYRRGDQIGLESKQLSFWKDGFNFSDSKKGMVGIPFVLECCNFGTLDESWRGCRSWEYKCLRKVYVFYGFYFSYKGQAVEYECITWPYIHRSFNSPLRAAHFI